MKTSRALTAIGFGLVVAIPACGGNFSLGNGIDAGQGGNSSSVGGSNQNVGGAGQNTGGAIQNVGGAGQNTGGTAGSSGITCLYDNVNHAPGDSFKSTDGCNTCSCTSSGQVACTEMACLATGGSSGVGGSTSVTCHYNNVNYAPGSSFKSTDGCNTCSCSSSGQVACTAMACLATGGSSGVGGSTGSTCTCSGPAPGAPTVQCWDGSIGGPVCATNTTGTCAWQIRSCPPNPGTGGTTGAGGTTGIGGTTGTPSCTTAADCTGALPALCQQCTDGSNGCAHFVCNSGSCAVAYCDNVRCVYNGVTYTDGSSFAAPDGCNTCSCTSSGQVVCTKVACVATGGSSGVGGSTSAGGTSAAGGTSSVGGTGTSACPTGQIWCSGCAGDTGHCDVVCPAVACTDCASLTTLEACEASTSCHSVFVDPGTCDCAAIGCCARFSRCANGDKALCTEPSTIACDMVTPHCEDPAYVVSYTPSCYEGCVKSKDCAN
jgi:hypothetical protein